MSYTHAFQESVCPACHKAITPGSKITIDSGRHLECDLVPVAHTPQPATRTVTVPHGTNVVLEDKIIVHPPKPRERPPGSKNKPKENTP